MEWLLEALRAAAEPTRLRLLAICCLGELTVTELTQVLGQSQPRVSRHLKLLCDAALLERFREQNFVFYRVARGGEGGALVRRVLAFLPSDAEILALDRQRVEEVLKHRAQEASQTLQRLKDESHWMVGLRPQEKTINQTILKHLDRVEVGELLDIGTGTGRMLKLLGDRTGQALGIDISADMLRLARTQLHEAGLDHVSVRHGDMYQLPYANERFDTITIDQVLSHADQGEAVIAEAARLLKPGGVLLVVDYEDTVLSKENLAKSLKVGVKGDTVKEWLDKNDLSVTEQTLIPGKVINVFLFLANKADEAVGVA